MSIQETASQLTDDRKEKIKGSMPRTCIQYTRLHIVEAVLLKFMAGRTGEVFALNL